MPNNQENSPCIHASWAITRTMRQNPNNHVWWIGAQVEVRGALENHTHNRIIVYSDYLAAKSTGAQNHQELFSIDWKKSATWWSVRQVLARLQHGHCTKHWKMPNNQENSMLREQLGEQSDKIQTTVISGGMEHSLQWQEHWKFMSPVPHCLCLFLILLIVFVLRWVQDHFLNRVIEHKPTNPQVLNQMEPLDYHYVISFK